MENQVKSRALSVKKDAHSLKFKNRKSGDKKCPLNLKEENKKCTLKKDTKIISKINLSKKKKIIS